MRVSFSTFIDAVQACDASQLQPTITFSNNIFLGPLDATDAITGRKCTFDHNLAFPQSTNLGLYTTRADPMLVNAAAADFHLLAGSPAIDAADPAAATMPDFDGTPRPQGARADLGAFESK